MKQLDILTLIPVDEVMIYGKPYLQSIFESDNLELDERAKTRWSKFWDSYFKPTLMKRIDPHCWNIHDASDNAKDFVTRTNNPCERYNLRYNSLFPSNFKWRREFLSLVARNGH